MKARPGGILRWSARDSGQRGLARAKSREIPDALKLLDRLDLKGRIGLIAFGVPLAVKRPIARIFVVGTTEAADTGGLAPVSA